MSKDSRIRKGTCLSAQDLGAALQRLRGNGKLTAAEVGSRAGLPPGLLHKAESGHDCLSAGELWRVLEELGADFLMLHRALQGERLDRMLAVGRDSETTLREAG